MHEPTHAPGWRGRPRRTGPVESDYNIPRWQLRLEAIAPIGCATLAAIALAIGAYAFIVDGLTGHL